MSPTAKSTHLENDNKMKQTTKQRTTRSQENLAVAVEHSMKKVNASLMVKRATSAIARIISQKCVLQNRRVDAIEPETQSESEQSSDELFISEIRSTIETNTNSEIVRKLNLNGESISFKLDTGAQCNIIPQKLFHTLPNKGELQQIKTRITAYGGGNVPLKGLCRFLRCLPATRKTTSWIKLLPRTESNYRQ